MNFYQMSCEEQVYQLETIIDEQARSHAIELADRQRDIDLLIDTCEQLRKELDECRGVIR